MIFAIRLENEIDFFKFALKTLTHPLKGDYASPIGFKILNNQHEFEEFYLADNPSDYDGDEYELDIYDDIKFNNFEVISKLDLRNCPKSFPSIVLGNFQDSFDRMSDVEIGMLQFVPISGTQTFEDLDRIKELTESLEFIEAGEILDNIPENRLMADVEEIRAKEALFTYRRIQKEIDELIDGKC